MKPNNIVLKLLIIFSSIKGVLDLTSRFNIFKKSSTHKQDLTKSGFFKKILTNKRHFTKGFLIGLVISVIVTVMAWLGHYRPYDNVLTDFLQSVTYKKAKDVTLLFITEDEYKRGFKSISPLSRSRLADTIDMLVKLEASVIALDIDISEATLEDQKLLKALENASEENIPIVVTANLTEIKNKYMLNDNSKLERPYSVERLHFTNAGFILFEDASPGNQWVNKVMYGGVDCRMDVDGVFRRADPLYMIKENNSQRPVPSFPVAVSAAYLGMSEKDLEKALSNINKNSIMLSTKEKYDKPSTKEENHKEETEIHIGRDGRITPNFIGNYEHFDREVNLTRLFKDYGHGKSGGMTIFKDKVVIVGGSYDEKDFYITPVGRMTGMEILANITQNIINHNLIKHTNFWMAFVIEVLLGALVALAFILVKRFWATVICLLILLPVVVYASILSFGASYYWFDFIPTIAGVFLHGWFCRLEQNFETMYDKQNKEVIKGSKESEQENCLIEP